MIDVIYEVDELWEDTEGTEDAKQNKVELQDLNWLRTPSLMMPGTRVFKKMMLVHAHLDFEDIDKGAKLKSKSFGKPLWALGDVIPAVYDYENPIIHTVAEQVIDHPEQSYIDPETQEVVVYQEAWQEIIPAYTYEEYPVITPEHREELVEPDPILIDYMADIVDENGVATRPTELHFHVYAGSSWYLGE